MSHSLLVFILANITCTDGHCTTFCSGDFGCTSVIYTEGDQQCLICEDSYQTSLYISSSKTYINFTQEDVCKRSYLDDHMVRFTVSSRNRYPLLVLCVKLASA